MNISPSLKKESRNTRAISFFFLFVIFSNEIVSFSYASNGFNDSNTNKSELFNTPIASIPTNVSRPEVEKTDGIETVKKVYGGPGQAESSGFSLTSTDGMVDKFTGDFSYSIPLMDVEGYPIVMKYNSNVSVNTEASWVGLGWDLNLGAVAREMRGVPDEFNGVDKIVRTFHEKQDETTNGYKAGGYLGYGKIFKGKFLTAGAQVTLLTGGYNNSILGYGETFDFKLTGNYSVERNTKSKALNTKIRTLSGGGNVSIGYSSDSKHGTGINKGFAVSGGATSKADGLGYSAEGGVNFGTSFNSRGGLISKSFGWEAGAGYLKEKIEGTGEDEKSKIFGGNGSFSLGSTIMYGSQTSMPRVNMNMNNTSFNTTGIVFLNVKKPKNVFSVGLEFSTNSSLNTIVIEGNTLYQPVYGYLHSGKRIHYTGNDYPVMDFNRSREAAYSEEMKDLSFSIQTYDVFYANAMGLSGTFRARRNDVGTYYDPEASLVSNKDGAVDISNVEATAGVILKSSSVKLQVGVSLGTSPGEMESGVLHKEGGGNALDFTSQNQSPTFDNSVYFKSVGETTPETMEMYNDLNGSTPDYFNLLRVEKEIHLTNFLKIKGENVDGATINSANQSVESKPIIATVFTPKTASEMGNSSYTNYPLSGSIVNFESLPRVDGMHKSNHISAVDVVSTDGTKYTYGVPVYTILNDEVSFASTGIAVSSMDPSLVNYAAGVDNSVGNTRGWTGYYDKTEMPAYAHSFLLTEMKSSDYIDRTGDGISLDDVGSGYKFNYKRVYGIDRPFKWRFPVSGGSTPEALQSKGFLGSELDNMAHYTYGEKEIWYAHSVESKNLIAEFVLEDREDAYSVLNENGGLDNAKPLKLLKKIVLYNRSEKLANRTGAKPIQTVEFEYDYSLCLKNPSNKNTYLSGEEALAKSGKLTLKKIRVYMGDSKENGLSAQTFEYSTDSNPDFSYSNVDGWGNYKLNNPTKPNDLFPYAEQDVTTANTNINAYKLVAINNPIGGRTEISYEADNYGFVQNKRAMRYMDMAGMTNVFEFLKAKNADTWDGTMFSDFVDKVSYNEIRTILDCSDSDNSLYTLLKKLPYFEKTGHFDNDFVPNNIIVFKLETPLALADYTKLEADQNVKEKYFLDPTGNPDPYLDELYFKLKVKFKKDLPGQTPDTKEEIVPCNAQISEDIGNLFANIPSGGFDDQISAIGVMPRIGTNTSYEYGYVVLNNLNSGEQEAGTDKGKDGGGLILNPLQRSALDYVRQNLPDAVYGSCAGCTTDQSLDNAITFGRDMYKYMIKNGNYVPSFLPSSSIRLFEPDNVKIGGNARVSKITYKDNWNAISGEYPSSYTWVYNYGKGNDTRGVAAYETRAILDENPFYCWESFVNFKKHFPDESRFTAMPITDMLYPIPVIGYEEVIVTFNAAINNVAVGSSKGYSTSKFYTSKDFPTISNKTEIDKSAKVKKNNKLTGKTIDLFGFAQGFSVETNDYHGKSKEVTTHNKLDQLQARTTYVYYDLGEKIPMMDRSTTLTPQNIALEYDIHADSKFIHDETKLTNIGINLTWTLAPTPNPIPIPFPTFYRTRTERGYYSNVLVKHINRSAVVKGIVTEYMGSMNYAENLVYDKYTGNVIVSSLRDEFDDNLYNVSYPSHWYYGNLRDIATAYSGAIEGTLNAGVFSAPVVNFNDLYSSGDIIAVLDVLDQNIVLTNVRILQVNQNGLVLINENGTKFTQSGSTAIGLVKTNRKNRLNETMQSVVTKQNPLTSNNTIFTFPEKDIISASAITYTTRNNVRCGTPGWEDDGGRIWQNNEVEVNSVINPFAYGIKGDLVIDKQYSWQDEISNVGTVSTIRKDGVYFSSANNLNLFAPFYKFNSNTSLSDWYTVNEMNHPQHISSNPYQKWRDHGNVSVYNEYGTPLENVDPLGVKSAVLYGYNNALNLVPVAQAVNASQQEIAFDGFEDYNYYSTYPLLNDEAHFDFQESYKVSLNAKSPAVYLVRDVRHSGLYSLKVHPGRMAVTVKGIGSTSCGTSNGIVAGEFKSSECLCIKPFEPIPGEYLVSVWVKEDNSLNKVTYLKGTVDILVDDVIVGSFLPTGMIVDGWQRLEGVFTIPNGSTSIRVELKNTENYNNVFEYVYFDDFRIHPLLAGMTTTVYDPATLLPMASHDGYNFTTFFNYDENLQQVRVRVETEKGIQTISEGESGGQKMY